MLPDNLGGGRAVAEHLLGLGHRRIAVAAGSRRATTVADRLAGIEEALRPRGVARQVPVVEADLHAGGGKRRRRGDPRRAPRRHGDLALNDDMAIGVLSVLRERGIAVPGRISVTGFDDVAVAQDVAPR